MADQSQPVLGSQVRQQNDVPLDEFGVPPVGYIPPQQYTMLLQENSILHTRCMNLETRVLVLQEALQMAINPNRAQMYNPIGAAAKQEVNQLLQQVPTPQEQEGV